MAVIGDNSRINNPLISFNAIIDPDISMIHYAVLDYPDSDSLGFKDVLRQETSYFDMIYKVYHRKCKNPLYYLLNPRVTRAQLDEIYENLLEKEEDILDRHAVGTEMYNLILEFMKEPNISTNILVYSEAQKEYIKDEEKLHELKCVTLDDIKRNKLSFTQYYFKNIEELNPFIDTVDNATIYISTSDINLDEKGEDITLDNDIIKSIVYRNNKMCLFDIYTSDIIGGYEEDESDDESEV